jgi:hypothetical protein
MSFLKYMFDTEWKQRRDIEDLREMQHRMASSMHSGGASERWVGEIADEVKELAALVRVLMRKLSDAKLLDVAAIRDEVAEELAPRPKARPQQARAVDDGPIVETRCVKCKTSGWSNEMVKVGADYMCRPCAQNP